MASFDLLPEIEGICGSTSTHACKLKAVWKFLKSPKLSAKSFLINISLLNRNKIVDSYMGISSSPEMPTKSKKVEM
jgi:hypothetical protein